MLNRLLLRMRAMCGLFLTARLLLRNDWCRGYFMAVWAPTSREWEGLPALYSRPGVTFEMVESWPKAFCLVGANYEANCLIGPKGEFLYDDDSRNAHWRSVDLQRKALAHATGQRHSYSLTGWNDGKAKGKWDVLAHIARAMVWDVWWCPMPVYYGDNNE